MPEQSRLTVGRDSSRTLVACFIFDHARLHGSCTALSATHSESQCARRKSDSPVERPCARTSVPYDVSPRGSFFRKDVMPGLTKQTGSRAKTKRNKGTIMVQGWPFSLVCFQAAWQQPDPATPSQDSSVQSTSWQAQRDPMPLPLGLSKRFPNHGSCLHKGCHD